MSRFCFVPQADVFHVTPDYKSDVKATLYPIPAILPRAGFGHQFLCFSDSCSGIPGTPRASTFASVCAVVTRLQPKPEFVCFPGDEIAGLTTDIGALQEQWRYWFEEEMAWLDPAETPLFHTTGNHTTYDAASEAVFRQMLSFLPQNGPPGQEGLCYFVRRGGLLLVFVNTCCSALGGEGRVETEWLERTLTENADAVHKLVFGHHPVFCVNGYSGTFQREIEPANGQAFWQVLVRHNVLAYMCSHVLAYDVQVHEGVLQIVTAGAGTSPSMPPDHEYHHCLQAALDRDGLRYQVLDIEGHLREWLSWPFTVVPSTEWTPLVAGPNPAPLPAQENADGMRKRFAAWRFSGCTAATNDGTPQTLLGLADEGPMLSAGWIGLCGPEQRLTVLLRTAPNRSPHLWHGPRLPVGKPFSIQVAMHMAMGPGGLLWRETDACPWSSLTGASPWGPEEIDWPGTWFVGHDQRGPSDQPFRGEYLDARGHAHWIDPPIRVV